MDIYNAKQLIRQKIWATVFCAAILALCLCWASYLFVRTHAAVSVQTRSAYDHLGRDDTFHPETPNTYYLLNNVNLKRTADASPVKPDVFMQGEDTEYYGNYLDGFGDEDGNLSENECAVSADFAKRYHLKAGGTLVVHPHGGKDYTVTVKKILPEYFGLKRADLYKPKGAVVIGYNPAIANDEGDGAYMVYRFTDDTQNASFGSTDPITHKRDVLSRLKVNYYIAAGVGAFAVLFAVALADGILGGDERKDSCIFYGETANRRSQFLYIALYSLYKHMISFAGAIAAGGILTAVLCAVQHVVCGYKVVIFLFGFGILALAACTTLSILINFLYARFKR